MVGLALCLLAGAVRAQDDAATDQLLERLNQISYLQGQFRQRQFDGSDVVLAECMLASLGDLQDVGVPNRRWATISVVWCVCAMHNTTLHHAANSVHGTASVCDVVEACLFAVLQWWHRVPQPMMPVDGRATCHCTPACNGWHARVCCQLV